MAKKVFTFIGDLTRNVDQLSRYVDQRPEDPDQFSVNLAQLQIRSSNSRAQGPHADAFVTAKKTFTFAACGKKITGNTPAKPMTDSGYAQIVRVFS